jgi:hypothetical protein
MKPLEESEDSLWEALLSEAPDHDLARQVAIEAEDKDDGTGSAAAAIGYFWYMIPGDDRERTVKGRRWLELALERDPQEHLARLYLAHFEFDESRYERARDLLQALPKDWGARRFQVWRDLKNRELLLAIDLELDGKVDRGELSRLIADHTAAKEEDRANPDELEAAAKRAFETGNSGRDVRRILEWAEAVRRALES